jgi:hypothetical protein
VKCLPIVCTLVVVAAACVAGARAQQRADLSEAEVDKLRDTQGAGDRIKLYLDFMQERLTRFDDLHDSPRNPQLNTGSVLDQLMTQYVELDDELKDWIQYQYNHQNDMRAGLKDLLDRGARQLQELQHVQQSPGPYTSEYSEDLQNAIADMKDTLDGGNAAIAGQVKTFGELKQEQKESAAASKEAIKQQKKQIKEEKKLAKKEEKLQKKESKQQGNSNSDEDN